MRRKLDTAVIHAGELKPRVHGAVSLPIFQSSTYEFGGGKGTDYHDLKYIRLNNTPNHLALHAKLAALEGGEAALVAASGMAAISTTLLALLSAGDHFLIQECLYGGTRDLVTKDLTAYGITHTFVDPDRPQTWKQALRPNTKAFYLESLSNPLLQMGDLEAAARFAKEHGLISLIDNTFPSPVNLRPLELGFDLSLHSGTKYLNGHSDIVCGAVIGKKDLVHRVKLKLDHLGGSLDPHACFLLHRGLKTLAVRVERQNETGLALAKFLEGSGAVAKVNYPGLRSHPRHARARKLLDGFGGMLSFEPKGGVKAAEKLLKKLTLPIVAPSLGGVESLVTRPCTTSHSGLTAEERARLGVTDSLVRVSVGLEAAEDLIEDFRQALR
jgi:cystathionine beta-lyase/cystathionine gamma-synthase